MKLLLDTHVFLWYISADHRLPHAWQNLIRDSANDVYLSTASVWEAVVKYSLGKLVLPEPPADYLPRLREEHQIATLPIEESTLRHLARLPNHHRDPFDRLLIAQAMQYELTLVTVDEAMVAYGIPVLPVA
jgi:PIN domain nuclease of toxin-antitoxin system